MSQETSASSEPSEIIDFGFSTDDVDLSRPVLRAGRLRFVITSTNSKPNNAGTGKNTAIVFVLDQEAPAVKPDADGNKVTVKPGFKITATKPMQDSGKMRPNQWREWFTKLQLALGIKGPLNSGAWINKPLLCEVSVRPAHTDEKTGETYPESNEIIGFHAVA